MSHTSDPEVDEHLERAATAGMSRVEIERWRKELDARALDLCGCEASAKASVVVATFSALRLLGRRGQAVRAGLAQGALVTTVSAVAGKLLGQHLATQRRDRLVGTLAARTAEVASWSNR